jgi:hypothetical protein
MPMHLRRAVFAGLIGGAAAVHVSLVGMVGTFQTRDLIADIVTIGTVMPMLIAVLVGWRAGGFGRSDGTAGGPGPTLVRGAVAGGIVGLTLALLALLIGVVDISWIFVNGRAPLAHILQFDQGPGLGSALQILSGAAFGLLGSTLHLAPRRIARAMTIGGVVTIIVALMEPFLGAVLRNLSLDFIEELL